MNHDDLVFMHSKPLTTLSPKSQAMIQEARQWVTTMRAAGRMAPPPQGPVQVPGLDASNGYRPIPAERVRMVSELMGWH